MTRARKIFLLTFFVILFIHFTGFLSRPTIEYHIRISRVGDTSGKENLEILLPYPFYRGKPVPFYKGTYIKEIFPSVKTAADTKEAKATLVKDKKYGTLLKIYIKDATSDVFNIHFMDNTCTPILFTPLMFVKPLYEIYFLSPNEIRWYWKKEGNNFSAHNSVNTFLYSSSENIKIYLKFGFKKRFFLGQILVEEILETGKKNIPVKNKWSKHNIELFNQIKFY